jgi:hypothetical protein
MENEVIILVISHKEKLSYKEQISLLQLYRILGKYPIKFICPKGLNTSYYSDLLPNIEIDFINAWWQSSYENFGKLKIRPFLYRRYKKYKYILFYEPDAFVFRDELTEWCARGYDYIGAPWFIGYSDGDSTDFLGVGNGGFSLRKTSAMLNVWKFKYFYRMTVSAKELLGILKTKNKSSGFWKKLFNVVVFSFKLVGIFNNSHFIMKRLYYEDVFWGQSVPEYFPTFNVANVKEAIAFSFECKPSVLYELNDKKLPFGCHAWWRYDLAFWQPFIEFFGYNIIEE